MNDLSPEANFAAPNGAPKQSGMPRAELEAVIELTPFAKLLGARLDAYGEGRASLGVPLRSDLKMHLDFAHGAVVGFLADSACAWAAASVVGNVVTAEYKLNLLAPGVGEALRAEGEVVKVSGRMVVCRADVFGISGARSTLVATALATVMRLK
jgi:uncharacterized protein (TIGR00369 family)